MNYLTLALIGLVAIDIMLSILSDAKLKPVLDDLDSRLYDLEAKTFITQQRDSKGRFC